MFDGGCRDVAEIEAMNFPVFARDRTLHSVGRYINVSSNEPVLCGDVEVEPGDILVGDADGVVVVPHEHAAAVLRRAQELEARGRDSTEGEGTEIGSQGNRGNEENLGLIFPN